MTVIGSTRRDPTFEKEIAELRRRGITVHVVPMERRIAPLSDWRAFRRIRALLREGEYDIAHAHSSKAGFLTRFAADRRRTKVIYTPHGFAFEMRVAPWRRGLYTALERYAARRTDRLIAVCESERQAGLRAGVGSEDQYVVIPNGLDPEGFPPRTDRETARETFDLADTDFVYGSVGELRPQKGYDVLIEAAALVVAERPDSIFLVAGGGAARERLRADAARRGLGERVRFLGHQADVRLMLCALDVFVMPSRWEAAPYSLLEAMAVGLPVVASRVGGIVDTVREDEEGYLVPPGDARHLAGALLRMARDDRDRERVAANARRRVLADFDVHKTMAQLAELYRQVAAER